MASTKMHEQSYRRDLGDGLVLRWSTESDVDKVGELYSIVFRDKADSPPNARMAMWAQDLGSGRHPLCGPGDFAVVEDTRQGLIAAALIVLQQRWQYDDIPFPIGRPEAVASLPDYRNRGLVRAIFDLFHARSAARGQLAQGITGISYFYRQFGYEYAFDLGGERSVPFDAIPALKEGESEPYTLRDATLEDLPLIQALYEREVRGLPDEPTIVTTPFEPAYWRWMIDGQNPESGQGFAIQMIVDGGGRAVGYTLRSKLRWGQVIATFGVATVEDVPLISALPSVLRGLKAQAPGVTPWREGGPEPNRLTLVLGRSHPAYSLLAKGMVSRVEEPYAWYVRVPDLPGFIRHIAPVLERRLERSAAAGYTGELRLDFYRGGLRLAFERGKLTAAEDWRRPTWEPRPNAGFPPLVFLQLLFGRRSLDELSYAFPDVWADEELAGVLNALFPKRPSWAFGLD